MSKLILLIENDFSRAQMIREILWQLDKDLWIDIIHDLSQFSDRCNIRYNAAIPDEIIFCHHPPTLSAEPFIVVARERHFFKARKFILGDWPQAFALAHRHRDYVSLAWSDKASELKSTLKIFVASRSLPS